MTFTSNAKVNSFRFACCEASCAANMVAVVLCVLGIAAAMSIFVSVAANMGLRALGIIILLSLIISLLIFREIPTRRKNR